MTNLMQIMQMLPALKNNPMSVLGHLGIPQEIANNPQAVIQNLMNRGAISQEQYNQAMQMAKGMGAKF